MANREDVLKGLKCWTGKLTNCDNCVYDTIIEETGHKRCSLIQIYKDAISLLEPRLLTINEVQDNKIVYVESRGRDSKLTYYHGPALKDDFDKYFAYIVYGEDDKSDYRWSEYGKTWRCWNSEPTEKKMNEAPWND